MSEDQYTQQNPTEQYGQQQGQPAQQQSAPGTERRMGPKPDHGEESYRGSDRLSGKRALITGGDSGIGRAVAIAFAREGADVLISYLGDEEEADARDTVRLVEEAGRKGVAVRCDVREEANCRDLVERTLAELGGIDILVNNAAFQMSQDKGLLDITTEQFDRVFKTNVYAMFWLCKMAVPHLPEGSAIINTSSIQAFNPSPQLLDYATTKAAIANFTKALALNLADQGIRVNAVAPGPIWTPLIPATMPAEKVKQFGTDTPLGRPGQPAELAPAYVFFASQESSYVTGEILGVTGGKLTK
ncbi:MULTISPECIES: SDR family oxidoreductase [Micromonospora]|uniref:SDR family oxidoreductase n=1 Tax=Micromonospora solifontis TaxID=2487138 RepID=A0ABX9W9Q7_9ACTN|nr:MULTISPECIES: SDR family oxidoreductase [Micromonospora]NES13731.1 SDR family oxidoreductase [Micromonospora sp. PPF5-17B]NES39227.1 SDR family oxidoreductase [Micromonospora solifontis]NES55302.1 SDR family oxidoreductase [Micromonospora sp. PPF5-6]RNL89926.1 SDR family oxidoreductase [Micromonospora solifontis]